MWLVAATCLLVLTVTALDTAPFASSNWVPAPDEAVDQDHYLTFTVALHLRDRAGLKAAFHSVSDPRSASYGQFWSADQLAERFSPNKQDLQSVVAYFKGMGRGSSAVAEVEANLKGDMLRVTTNVAAIENHFDTKLQWHKHAAEGTHKRSVRAVAPLRNIPDSVARHIAFVSLNAPVNHMMPRGAKALRQKQEASGRKASTVGVTTGNKEALVTFAPICGDGLPNTVSPPCSTQTAANTPQYKVLVTQHNNNASDPFWLTTDPMEFLLVQEFIFCFNNITMAACTGPAQEGSCVCTAKVSPLPMYTQLRFNVTSKLPADSTFTQLGVSDLYALTDVATVGFLSELYKIPAGQAVHTANATQGVAEFYGEYYSNADLAAFLALSGLPNASIPTANVLYGTNDEASPGGEAQLDVEYLMGLAPGAPTYFYSIDTLNPYSPENEGFLTWLYFVGNETNPPLVQSLSYGDVEASVFPPNNQSAYDYGVRCDDEFMLLGMRGISILVSSGDDGIGGSYVRDDPEFGCSQAWPAWPASSPYVTTIGATMMTDNYLPVCGRPYSTNLVGAPMVNDLMVQCSGTRETVCTAAFGGVITSGGGFSNVSDRAETAPWQVDAVDKYLAQPWAQPSTPGYYNSAGRAYPDVATYGSNYFVYLDGSITRESGTSASAPVFSAMVTLWNDLRFAYDMPPMGFVAPFLYYVAESNPEAFNDIVTGDNACSVGRSLESTNCCSEAFAAAPGWDAVTGLGSPNFQVLANLVLNNATKFGAMGAYPDGGVTTTNSDSSSGGGDDDDDDDDKFRDIAVAALIISLLSLLGGGYAIFKLTALSQQRDGTRESLVESSFTKRSNDA